MIMTLKYGEALSIVEWESLSLIHITQAFSISFIFSA